MYHYTMYHSHHYTMYHYHYLTLLLSVPMSILFSSCIRLFTSASTKLSKTTLPKNEALLRFQTARLLESTGLRPASPVSALLATRPPSHDLILVDGRPDPPLVRFQAHAEAFKAQLLRKEAETRSRLANKLKELHLSTATSAHDFATKAGKARDWLLRGWRVRVLVEQKQQQRRKSATLTEGKGDERRAVLARMMEHLAGIAEQSGAVEVERGNLVFTLGPTTRVLTQLKLSKREDKISELKNESKSESEKK
jgi:translation initiation factor IF-3